MSYESESSQPEKMCRAQPWSLQLLSVGVVTLAVVSLQCPSVGVVTVAVCRCRYGVVTVSLHCRYGVVTLSLQCRYGVVTVSLRCRYGDVTVAVVAAFFVCWAPFHTQRLMAIYAPADPSPTLEHVLKVTHSVL